jgi:hypothetical protein
MALRALPTSRSNYCAPKVIPWSGVRASWPGFCRILIRQTLKYVLTPAEAGRGTCVAAFPNRIRPKSSPNSGPGALLYAIGQFVTTAFTIGLVEFLVAFPQAVQLTLTSFLIDRPSVSADVLVWFHIHIPTLSLYTDRTAVALLMVSSL